MAAGRRRSRRVAAGVLLATTSAALATACSPGPATTTKLSVTSAASATVTPTHPAANRSTAARTTAAIAPRTTPVQSLRRPVLSLAVPAGWQRIGISQLGDSWVGVRAPALTTDGYQPNVLASAINSDQDYEQVKTKPVMCQEPTASGAITQFTVLGHGLRKFRNVDSCVSDAEYNISNGLRIHELNVVFTASDANGKAALVQLAGRTSKAGWPKLKQAVEAVMESLRVTP